MESLLAERYGISNASLRPTELGAVNQNFFVDAADGARFVLKRYATASYDRSDVERSCQTQSYLNREGLPVPPVIPNLQGDLITEAEGTFWVLHGYVQGRHYRRNETPAAAARSMGRAHGQIMRALGSLQPVANYELPTPAEAMADLQRLLALTEQGTGPVDATAAAVLRYKIGAVERLAPILSAMNDLAVQWVHGDYQDTNVLYGESDQVVAVLDFDNLRCRPRGYDVMRAFAYSFPGAVDRAYEYFRGYAQEYRLSVDEAAGYAPLWAYLSSTRVWPIDARYRHPATYQERWDRFIQPPDGWWEEHWESVSARLREIAAHA